METVPPQTAPQDAVPTKTQILLRRAWQHRLGVLGAVIIAVLLIMAVFAPVVATYDPYKQNIITRLKPPEFMEGGRAGYWLGTDQLGRDTYSRIVYGARISLAVGVGAVALSAVIGVVLGLAGGYFGGWLDAAIDFSVNAMLAFPFILLAMSLVLALGPSLTNIILALGLSNWTVFARVTRIETMKLRDQEFVLAAVTQGLSRSRILFKHILRNLWGPLLVIATVEIARSIIRETLLSFLGLGIQPPIPSWGVMLAEGRDYMLTQWWLAALPGFAIFLSALGINLAGDSLRDLLDPRLRKA